ncbi:MAG: low molecular weight phosphotyrosine protein phosphatase [Clostridia bacterium]|nr:low molecular weight phosphotyrosine protein phosphatase [Clostridia bacterium]
MTKILFVCHGNICRSPMAEFIFKDEIKKRSLEGVFYAESAATSTEEIGNPVYPPAARELASHGISCRGHAARRLCRDDLEKFDLFIGMDEANRRNMLRILGEGGRERIGLLLDFEGREVADPWYSDRFDLAYGDIYRGVCALIDRLTEDK